MCAWGGKWSGADSVKARAGLFKRKVLSTSVGAAGKQEGKRLSEVQAALRSVATEAYAVWVAAAAAALQVCGTASSMQPRALFESNMNQENTGKVGFRARLSTCAHTPFDSRERSRFT